MSLHIGARPGEIAETVLIAGDPLRAKYVAEHFLEDSMCYTQVRGMYGYTGLYEGKRVSVQGTGMGIPSTAIYVTELIKEYGVQKIIRIGTCGSIQKELKLGDVIIALAASSDSQINTIYFKGMDFAPAADYELLKQANLSAIELGIPVHNGSVFSTDLFYNEDSMHWKIWAAHKVLGLEMETSVLYTLAARHGVQALALLSVSDNLLTGQISSAEARETSFMDMVKIALLII